MKKLLLFLLLASPLSLQADSVSVGGSFRGLNNGDSSMLIQDNEAQDLLNVDITKNGFGISKRAGYAQFRTIGVSTWGVRGGYYFTDQSGNNKIIHANDKSVYHSLNGAAYSAFYSTASNGGYWDFTDSQGVLYGASHNHDPPFTWNGTTITFSTSVVRGSQVEALPDRLVITGATATPNTIFFSRSAFFDDWTIGALTDVAPFSEYYGLPGQLVQAIKYHLGELLIWTKTSMGRWVGTNQFDGVIDDISNTVGTDQPSTVVTDLGVTYFQATDRHFYSYDGQGLRKLSQAISASVDGFASADSKSAVLTTQADFAPGVFEKGISSTTSSGDVVMNSPTETLSQTDGAGSNYDSFSAFGNGLAQSFIFRQIPSASSGTLTIDIKLVNGGFGPYPTVVSTWTLCADNSNAPGVALATATLSLVGPLSPTVYTLTLSTNIYLSNNTRYWLHVSTVSGDSSGTWNWYRSTTNNPYSDGNAYYDGTGANTTVDFYFVSRFSSYAGTYQSPVVSIGSAISAWDSVDISNVLNNGNITYGIYSDTNTAITISDSNSWVSSQTITNNSIPTFAVNPYITWMAYFTRTSSAPTPTVNDLTLSWFEGAITRHWGAADKDHRILWSVAEGTATAPNATYIYDPRFDSWLKYSVPFDAPAKVGDSLYFGGVSTGVVYQFPSGNTDNGSAITAYWKSKDFIAPDPYIEKDFIAHAVVAKTQTGANLDITYTINTSSAITRNFSLTDPNGLSLRRINSLLPSGKFGTFFSLKFGNDDSDAPFEFYSFRYDYKPRPWRVMQ